MVYFKLNAMFLATEHILYYILILLPITLFIFFWLLLRESFFDWRSEIFHSSREMMLLEIKIPQEITKTPLAMEMVFQSLYIPGREGTWDKKKYSGKRRPQFSLEIVSDGGEIRFYIQAETAFKKFIETSFYAQYPSVEIIEVPDYTKFVAFNPQKEFLLGVEYGLSKPDPFPIKTYDKFGLDKVGLKEEEIQDPMSYLLEAMGSVKKGDQMWMQIIFKAQKTDNKVNLSILEKIKNRWKTNQWEKATDWSTEAKEIIEGLREEESTDTQIGEVKFQKSTPRQTQIIDDIIENISKPSFWVTIRSIYKTSHPENVQRYGELTKLFFATMGTTDTNSIGEAFETDFKYLWDDYNGKIKTKMRIDAFADYKRRKMSGVYKKYFTWGAYDKTKYKQMRLSTAELATIFHLPFTAISSPTLERSKFKKAEAPINLPK